MRSMRRLWGIVLLFVWCAQALHAAPARSATALAFAADGRLYVGWSDGVFEAWAVHPDTMLHRWTAARKAIDAVSVSDDGRMVATASSDGTVRVYDAASYQALATLSGADGPISFRADGTMLTGRAGGRGLTRWRLVRGGATRLGTLLSTQLVYAADRKGTTIATASGQWVVRLWRLAGQGSPRLATEVKSQGWGGISGALMSPDGTLLSVLGSTIAKPPDAFSRMFSTRTGKEVGYYVVGTNIYNSAISADNGTLALAGSVEGGGSLAVYNLRTGKSLWSLNMFTQDPPAQIGDVRVLALSARGDLLATAGPGEPIRIWDNARGKVLSTLVP